MSDSYILFERDTARDIYALELIDILFNISVDIYLSAQTSNLIFLSQKIMTTIQYFDIVSVSWLYFYWPYLI